jgi:hypothetical protein
VGKLSVPPLAEDEQMYEFDEEPKGTHAPPPFFVATLLIRRVVPDITIVDAPSAYLIHERHQTMTRNDGRLSR